MAQASYSTAWGQGQNGQWAHGGGDRMVSGHIEPSRNLSSMDTVRYSPHQEHFSVGRQENGISVILLPEISHLHHMIPAPVPSSLLNDRKDGERVE